MQKPRQPKQNTYLIPVRIEEHYEDTMDVVVEASTLAEARELAVAQVWDVAGRRSGAVIERHAAVVRS